MLENLNRLCTCREYPASEIISSDHVPQFIRNENGYLTTTTISNNAYLLSIGDNPDTIGLSEEEKRSYEHNNSDPSSFNTIASCWTVSKSKIEGAKRRIHAKELCGRSGSHLFGHSCLKSYFVPYRCKNPFCPTCARLDSVELARKYEPILKGFNKYTTKFLTLTLKNVELAGLNGAIDSLMKSFTCLKDIRFGTGAFKWYDEIFPVLLEYSKLEKFQQERQMYLYGKFKQYMLNVHKNKCKSPKLRNVSKGLARLEIVNKGNGYHVHLHVILDIAAPIPQELISHLWEQLTSGSMVVDIRRVYGDFTKELLKYQLKYWEFKLDDEEMLQVLASLYGRKKIWTWGVKVEKAEKQCFCGDSNCQLEYKGPVTLMSKMTHSVMKGTREGEWKEIVGYDDKGRFFEVVWDKNAFVMERLE